MQIDLNRIYELLVESNNYIINCDGIKILESPRNKVNLNKDTKRISKSNNKKGNKSKVSG